MKTIAITALAGLAAVASAQSLEVSFIADATEVNVGDTVNWTVNVTATGYAAADQYLGGFVGSFDASDAGIGEAGDWVSNFNGNATTPTFDGATINGINSFNSALLGTDDQALQDAFTYSTTIAGDAEVGDTLSYSSTGVWSYFADGDIFGLPDEFTAPTTNSDTVTVVPAPGAFALLGLGGLVAGRRRR